MNKVLTIIAVVMMGLMGFNAAHADAREDLIAAARSINDTCPQGDDVVLKSVTVEGDNLVFTYIMNASKTELDQCKKFESDVVGDIADGFRADETYKPLYDLCKEAKCNLVVRFSNRSGQFVDLILPNKQMK